jgi:hypothetical protein
MRGWWKRGFRGLFLMEFGRSAGFEGPVSGEELVENEPQGINVALYGGTAAGPLLGRHVGRSPGQILTLIALSVADGQPEIHNSGLTAAVDHDVGGLQVPMDDALVMGGGKPRTELMGNF